VVLWEKAYPEWAAEDEAFSKSLQDSFDERDPWGTIRRDSLNNIRSMTLAGLKATAAFLSDLHKKLEQKTRK